MKTVLNNIKEQINKILESLKTETVTGKRELLFSEMEQLARVYEQLNIGKELLHG